MSKTDLYTIYHLLSENFGPQYWWPGETQFEIIVGAILTQNTNWGNVERALNNLKSKDLLNPSQLRNLPVEDLAALIKPAGYFNVKSKRLKNFLQLLFSKYDGKLDQMATQTLDYLRTDLLSVNGIGEETADSILLYAFDKPVFVVDAYTKRLLYRHHLIDHTATYQDIQQLFMTHLEKNRQVFNEYHALIVRVGKEFCKPNPKCETCPLNGCRYSLKYRCERCFKYLVHESGRKETPTGYICRGCG